MSNQGLQGQIDQLQQQITALQQQLAQVTADNISPSYLTLDDAGHVSANFNGFLEALGIELPTFLASGKASQSFIKWTDPGNGLLGGGLVIEYQPAGQMYAVLQANAEHTGDLSQANLKAMDDTDTMRASINVTQQNRGASSSVNAFAGADGATIINQAGHSDFGRVVGGQVVFNGVSIPGQSKQDFVISLGAGVLPTYWQLLVMLRDNGASTFLSYCTWALISNTANSVTFEVANNLPAGDTATGSIAATILNVT